MGTRNLTMVVNQQGKTKIAQYGQWDGYPDGQGMTCLNFLRKKGNLKKLESKFSLIRFSTKKDEKEVDDFLISIGCKDGWMTGEQADEYHKRYPLLTRDHGANILNLLLKVDKKVFIGNQQNFAMDSLFCEWGYVVDLQKGTFEIYEGFNKGPLDENARFKYLESKMKEGDEYYPIKLIKEYELSNLPSKKEFLDAFIKEES